MGSARSLVPKRPLSSQRLALVIEWWSARGVDGRGAVPSRDLKLVDHDPLERICELMGGSSACMGSDAAVVR